MCLTKNIINNNKQQNPLNDSQRQRALPVDQTSELNTLLDRRKVLIFVFLWLFWSSIDKKKTKKHIVSHCWTWLLALKHIAGEYFDWIWTQIIQPMWLYNNSKEGKSKENMQLIMSLEMELQSVDDEVKKKTKNMFYFGIRNSIVSNVDRKAQVEHTRAAIAAVARRPSHDRYSSSNRNVW